jgi:hypothetical protein
VKRFVVLFHRASLPGERIWSFDAEDAEAAQQIASRVIPKSQAKFCRVVPEGESK